MSKKRSYADAIREPHPRIYEQVKNDIMNQLGTPAMRAALKVLQELPLPSTDFNSLMIYAVQNLPQCSSEWSGAPAPNVHARFLKALDSAERTLWPPPSPVTDDEIRAARMSPQERRQNAANATMLAVIVFLGRNEMHAASKKDSSISMNDAEREKKKTTTNLITHSIQKAAPGGILFDVDVLHNNQFVSQNNTLYRWWTL